MRKKSVKRKFPGGIKRFKEVVPNNTYCFDDNFLRIGFMKRDDSLKFLDFLEDNGLTYVDENEEKAIDFVIAQQDEGFFINCDWAELILFHISGDKSRTVMACRKPGSNDDTMVAPDGWEYEKSFYNTAGYLTPDQIKANLKFIRRENNVEIYQHRETGKYYYVGRTTEQDN